VAIFELTNGIIATYRGSWCSEGLHTSWECDWRFVGQRGSAIWKGGLGDGDDFTSQVLKPGEQSGFMRNFDSAPISEMDTAGIENGHESCIRDFVSCVRSGAQPLTRAADNIKSLAMCFGAIESAEGGLRVEIESRS
jgi:predicted dehydrogenase